MKDTQVKLIEKAHIAERETVIRASPCSLVARKKTEQLRREHWRITEYGCKGGIFDITAMTESLGIPSGISLEQPPAFIRTG